MRKKKHKELTTTDIAFNDWMERNKWFIWGVVLFIGLALAGLIWLIIFYFRG